MISSPSPTKPSSKMMGTNTKSRFIHTFGYHLAKKMLGVNQVNKCIRQAYQELQQEQEDPKEDPFRCFRANWRSGVRFPWQLPESNSRNLNDENGGKIERETLFVDLTFDFIIFPIEIVDEGRTNSCHVLKNEDFCDSQEDQQFENGMEESIAISVAVRIGSLVAIPSSQCNQNTASMGKNAGGRDDGYKYYYQRGDTNSLTVSDLDEHCRCIDIVLEDMDAEKVASIIGEAFLDGRNGNLWQLKMKPDNDRGITINTSSNLSTIDNVNIGEAEKPLRIWCVKVHHETLQADGLLPLSYNYNSDDAGDQIGKSMLDVILLQSSTNCFDGVCVSVPKEEALVLWKNVNPAVVRALEKPVEPSPKKLSPSRVITAEPAALEEEQDTESKEISSKTKTAMRRPPKPQQAALYARGKKTTLGGSRRKKPKFTFGPP